MLLILSFPFVYSTPSNLLTPAFLLRLPSSGAIARDAAQLAPTKALKTGAYATLHTALQPLPVVDIVAEAAKLQEAMARGAQKAQLARAPESWGDAGQSGVVTAAGADAEEELGRGGTDDAARLDVEIEAGRGDADSTAQPVAGGGAGGGAQECPVGQREGETFAPELLRAGVEGVMEEELAPRWESRPVRGGEKGWAAPGRAGRKEVGDGLGRAGAWAGPVWAEGLVSSFGFSFFSSLSNSNSNSS